MECKCIKLICQLTYFRFVISGILSSTGYTTKFPASTLALHPDFAGSSMIMSVVSSGQYTVTSESGVSINSFNTFSVGLYSVTSYSVTYIITASNWGDGIILSSANEEWDDANIISLDGWSSICKIENGYECTPNQQNNNISKWTLKCGNGVINSPEICDDKNNVNGDGCSSTCTIENGYECAPDTSNNSISKWTLKCGNGVINSPEICDDKNNVNGDGCSRYECAPDTSNSRQYFKVNLKMWKRSDK